MAFAIDQAKITEKFHRHYPDDEGADACLQWSSRMTLILSVSAVYTTLVLKRRLSLKYAYIFLVCLVLPLSSCAPQLTAEQRRQDIELLARWAKDYSPTVAVNERYRGLPSYEALGPQYIELAEKAGDNKEFLQVVFGYFNLIGASGHGHLYPKEILAALMVESLLKGGKGWMDISWHQYARGMYWSGLLEGSFVHPPFRVVHRQNEYVTAGQWQTQGVTIPKDSRILRVNGMTCKAYVQHLKEETWLRYVAGNVDWISKQLLVIPEAKDFRGWNVEFLLSDGSTHQAFVPSRKGLPSPRSTEFLDYDRGNCVCVELTDKVGYVRVKALVHAFRKADQKRIRRFLDKSQGRYEKLIIDVRGNGGGSTFYVYETLIQPFLREPAIYMQTTGVRKKFLADKGSTYVDRLRGGVSQWAWEMKIEETGPPDGFDPCEWVFYEITREVKPSDPYCFDGRLYVLADRGSGSATETYADAVKRTGLGTIVGQRTAGGLGGYFMADTVRLPASGMIFRLEADLDINPDGSFQELAGTKPDVELPPCDLPEKSTKEELLKDAWIRKVIEEL